MGNELVLLLRHEMQMPTMIVACIFAAVTGALLRRWCAGRRYGYQLVAPNPETRERTDRPVRHAVAMLSAGTLTGVCIGGWFGPDEGMRGAAMGTACALVFLPVGFAVLGAARRAQRGRLGSIVAASDRRAVWGILAALLGATTIEAAPNWATLDPKPVEAAFMLLVSTVVVTGIFVLDLRAYKAFDVLVRDLDLEGRAASADAPARVDLGVGDDVGARLERSRSPYRGSDRALALVIGDRAVARRALKRAMVRGVFSILLLAAATSVHVAATTGWARDLADREIEAQCHSNRHVCWSRCW